ncbi:MAG: hypothetical protein ACYC6X_00815 [Minisyncoccota bacterium]
MKRIIAVVALSFLFIRAVSADGGICVQSPGTLIVFGNGIMSTKADATIAKERLRTVLKTSLTADEFNKLEFGLAYNKSYGFFSDFYESLKQKLSQDNVVESFWRWLGNQQAAPQVVRDEALRIASAFDFSTQVGTNDLDIHLQLYRTKIAAGKTVVVVAHSQGNPFANAAYDVLYNGITPIPANSFGIVSVANPASFVGGGGPYTTAEEDLVIAAITQLTPVGVVPPLPPNITNSGSGATTSDWLGHSITDEYLADGSRTEPKIVADVEGMIASLTAPPVPSPGIITASPARVASGRSSTIAWHVCGVNHCTVTNSTTGIILTDGDADGQNQFFGSASSGPITQQTIFKISCTTDSSPVSSWAGVNVNPIFGEF